MQFFRSHLGQTSKSLTRYIGVMDPFFIFCDDFFNNGTPLSRFNEEHKISKILRVYIIGTSLKTYLDFLLVFPRNNPHFVISLLRNPNFIESGYKL